MTNEVAQEIEDVLGPMVGLVLARVSVELESKRIGKSPESIQWEDLPSLADNLAVQLRLLVGRDIAEAAAQRVRVLSP
ncbi:MAG: hypothetical protein ACYC6J_06740 [Coriobacteriia bacterium]